MKAKEIANLWVDLLNFTRHMFKVRKRTDFILNSHHYLICEKLERVLVGDIKRLIINIPPRYGKTELILNFVAWSLGLYPDSEFIISSYSKRLAVLNSYLIKEIIESDEYKSIFYTRIKKDSRAKDEFRTIMGGLVYASGVGGSITGFGAGKHRKGRVKEFGGAIIIDDPHKAGEVHSKLRRESLINWYKNTLSSRVNSKDTPIIVIMQRLHMDDLSGYLLRSGEKWEHLKLAVVGEDNKPLWSSKHNLKDLELIKARSPYVYSSQYLQEPIREDGNIFKKKYIKYYDKVDRLEYINIFADTASKTGTMNDFTVFLVWGRSEDGNIYLLDIYRDKIEAPKLIEMAKLYYYTWDGRAKDFNSILRYFYIEDKSSGIGLIQSLRAEKLRVKSISRHRDKISRAYDCLAYMHSNRVFLKKEISKDLELELLGFPNFRNDDMVDALMDAINIMLIEVRSLVNPKLNVAKDLKGFF